MVFIGDGFALEDQSKWKSHVDEMVTTLFSSSLGEPFGRYKKFFNIYRIDMISKYSGLDVTYRSTPLRGMASCRDFTKGDCIVDWNLANGAIDYYMAQYSNPKLTFREIALNSDKHIGAVHYPSTGIINTYSAGNEKTKNIFIHENGHMAGLLADEYTQIGKENDSYQGGEPNEVNVTTITNPVKWQHWIGFVQPYTISGSATVGLFEGGKYVGKGIYRPAEQCMMNAFTNPFCAVCREKIILDFYKAVRPVDTLIVSLSTVTVQLIDPDLFDIKWYVDDNLVASSGLSIDLNELGITSGEHVVKVLVSDKILNYSYTGLALDWVRKDLELLKQEVNRKVTL